MTTGNVEELAVLADRDVNPDEREVVGVFNNILFSFLQFLADGLKLFLKEDIIPALADRKLFIIAPLIVFSASFASYVVVPWSETLTGSDLNIGILYILSISSIAGLGSNR